MANLFALLTLLKNAMTLFLPSSTRDRNQHTHQTTATGTAKKIAKTGLLALSIALSSLSVGAGLKNLPPAYAQRTAQFNLDSAICSNEWSTAIDIIGTLIGDDLTTSRDRTALLALRNQLAQYRAENTVVVNAAACDRTNPYQLEASNSKTVQSGGEPLGWEGAVAAASQNGLSASIVTEGVPFDLPVEVDNIAGLTPASPIDLSRGLNIVSGQVGTGHRVYSFVAGLGDSLTIDLDVTRVMAGTLYTSDDSQLFLFDREGKLLTTADDTSGQQSRISNFVVPKTDVYFAVVTSYNNDPILTREDYLTGWQDNGGGRFDYTLRLSGVTRTSALVRE